MKWEKPEIVEIGMNAEIGGYQSDFGDSEPAGPRAPVADGKQVESKKSAERRTSPKG